ncbi:MAG: peptidylprolyl isomerase [Hyphomonadaceae bacterium]|nr:peptidylprolyl isomerase [Hyphomonadaceae bacterium]
MRLNLKTVGIATAVLFALTGLTGCGQPAEVQVSSSVIDSSTAARVNGETIYMTDVRLEAVAQGLIEPNSDFGPTHPDFHQVLEQLIDQRLLAQEALRRGLDKDPTAERRLAAGRERLLGNILVESLVANEVTEEAIDRMYEEQVKLQQLDDEVRLRQIVVENRELADQILQELVDGRDFAEAALEYSEDVRTRLEGGDLGWVAPNELLDPIPAVIGNTVTGTWSEAFETEDGWIILKVDERRTTPPKTKQEMRPEIITFLTFTQISDILTELRASAQIQQRDPAEYLNEAEEAAKAEAIDAAAPPEQAPSE